MEKHIFSTELPCLEGARGRFVVLAGNIGAGKTTLASVLASRLDWIVRYESVDDNPYLADFYEDKPRWVFQLGMSFLVTRATQHLEGLSANENVILDRSIYEDRDVFIPALKEAGILSPRDHSTYMLVWDLLGKNLPPPDLLIYLRAPCETLLQRVKSRARHMERNITMEYLQLLERYYEQWIGGFDLCPVLKIDTSESTMIQESLAQDSMIASVRSMLGEEEPNE